MPATLFQANAGRSINGCSIHVLAKTRDYDSWSKLVPESIDSVSDIFVTDLTDSETRLNSHYDEVRKRILDDYTTWMLLDRRISETCPGSLHNASIYVEDLIIKAHSLILSKRIDTAVIIASPETIEKHVYAMVCHTM